MILLMGFTRAVKPETSGCLCSHIGCHITSPLASRKVRSDSWGQRRWRFSNWLHQGICHLAQTIFRGTCSAKHSDGCFQQTDDPVSTTVRMEITVACFMENEKLIKCSFGKKHGIHKYCFVCSEGDLFISIVLADLLMLG